MFYINHNFAENVQAELLGWHIWGGLNVLYLKKKKKKKYQFCWECLSRTVGMTHLKRIKRFILVKKKHHNFPILLNFCFKPNSRDDTSEFEECISAEYPVFSQSAMGFMSKKFFIGGLKDLQSSSKKNERRWTCLCLCLYLCLCLFLKPEWVQTLFTGGLQVDMS